MKTTGIYTNTLYTIPFSGYGETIQIVPFGDVHRSSPLCHVDKWKEFCDWGRKQKNTYYLGMGDYNDLASTSERSALKSEHLHEATKYELESLYRRQTALFANEIDFMKGKLIGLIEGNHYADLPSGITTTQLMAEMMGCPYLGVSAFIRLIIQKNRSDSHQVDIWAHHGLAGGRKVGASINKLEDMIKTADADLYCMGHDHRKTVAMDSRLYLSRTLDGVRLENRKIVMCRTGSFLKGYEADKSSYIADAGLPPTDIGNVVITMKPYRSRVGREIKINATL